MRTKSSLALAAVLLLASCAASDPGPQSASREMTVARTARVQTVDLETRQVLLRMDNDDMLSLVAGPEVRNLAQLEPGDVVRFDYYEAVAAKMADASSAGDATGAMVSERAPEGAKPGAGVAAAVNMVVEFISYDPSTHLATFRTPEGIVETASVKPEMREFAAARKPGDRVDLTITRAVAVSIEETGG
jgi:hypothetical protein